MVAWETTEAFIDEYYPAPAAEPVVPPTGSAEGLARYVAVYRLNRVAYSTPGKFMQLFATAFVWFLHYWNLLGVKVPG